MYQNFTFHGIFPNNIHLTWRKTDTALAHCTIIIGFDFVKALSSLETCDNRPSTSYLHHFVLKKCVTWHLTPDSWHITPDTCHMTCVMWWGVNLVSKFQLPRCNDVLMVCRKIGSQLGNATIKIVAWLNKYDRFQACALISVSKQCNFHLPYLVTFVNKLVFWFFPKKPRITSSYNFFVKKKIVCVLR